MNDDQAASRWAAQSAVTDPGAAAGAIDALPAELAVLREASSQLVFHYRAGGDFAENGVPAERMAEIDTRYADAMLALILERGAPALGRERRAADRVVGCCRDATVLFVALARHKGIPARVRVGFAAYFHPGWLVDHVVAEVWDDRERRWRVCHCASEAVADSAVLRLFVVCRTWHAGRRTGWSRTRARQPNNSSPREYEPTASTLFPTGSI